MLPRPNRSSTNPHEGSASVARAVKELNERDYENILTDQTRKQYTADEDQLLTPNRRKYSVKEDGTSERKNSAKKKIQGEQARSQNYNPLNANMIDGPERSISARHTQLARPEALVVNANSGQPEQMTTSSVILPPNVTQSTMVLVDEALSQMSQVTAGQRTQYATADQVVSHYQNLGFMPQKKERLDRLEVLKQSHEFNPVIEFDINSPYSS